jgi:hypothetical protein
MNDFTNRVDAQRQVLLMVNAHQWAHEELFGLSEGALRRWEVANGLDPTQALSVSLRRVSVSLQALANKSQEQVTGDYQSRSLEVSRLTREVESVLDRLFA